MRKLNNIMLILAMTLLASCGYLKDTPVEDSNVYRSPQLGSDCTIDPAKIGQIFVENVQEQIECIESKLAQFRYVKTQNRDVLTEGELSQFVKKFFDKNSETIIQGLSLVFELNMLLLRDEAGQISRDNITPLFKLLSSVNKEAIIIYQVFSDMSDKKKRADFWKNRELLIQAIERFSAETLKIIEIGHKVPKKINLKQFILDLQSKLSGKNVDEKVIDSLLFIKKLFLGGTKEEITSLELIDLVSKAPGILIAAFDAVLIADSDFSDKWEYHDYLIDKADNIENALYKHKDEEYIFDIDDLFNIAEQIDLDEVTLKSGSFKLRDYEKLIESFKKDLIGGDKRKFLFKDLKTIFTYLRLGIKSLQRYNQIEEITKDLTKKEEDDVNTAREKIYSLAKHFPSEAKTLIRNEVTIPSELAVLNFIETLNKETKTFNFDMEVVNALFSIKQLALGGSRELITRKEVFDALSKTKELAEIYFDIRYLLPRKEEAMQKRILLEGQLVKIESLLLKTDVDFPVLAASEAKKIIEFFFEKEDQSKFTEALVAFKKNILGGDQETYTFKEFQSALNYINVLIDGLNLTDGIKDFFKKYENDEISEHQDELLSTVVEFTGKLDQNLEKGRVFNKDVDIVSFLQETQNLTNLKDEDLDLIADVFPVKALLVGGAPDNLSKEDAKKLISKARAIVKLLIEAITLKRDKYETKLDFNVKVYEIGRGLNDLMEKIAPETNIIKVTSILRLLERFTEVKFTRFKRTIIDLKERLIELKPREELTYNAKEPDLPSNHEDLDSIFTKKDIDTVMNTFFEAFEIMIFTDATYDHMKDQLEPKAKKASKSGRSQTAESFGGRALDFLENKAEELNLPDIFGKKNIVETILNELKTVNFPNLPVYKKLREGYMPELKENFTKLATNYRYFRDQDSGMQHYTFKILRNKYGFEELSMIRWGLGKVLVAYGPYVSNPNDAKGNSITMEQLGDFLVGIRSILEEFNLWTSNFQFFSRNTLLLGDLFQSQSNGDMQLNQEEGTEYVALILQAVVLANKVMDRMKDICPFVEKSDGDYRIDPVCHRENFFDVVFKDLKFNNFFPQLQRYSTDNSKEQNIEFIRSIEGFARDIPIEEPMRIRDYTLVIGAMLNIESTFLRFDRNQDNVIDRDELDRAFEVYRNVILMLAPDLRDGNEKYARVVFFHMIKYMTIPCSKVTIFKHHNLFWFYYRNTEAQRVNIGSLLYYLVNGATCSDDEGEEPEE
ncbi:hypothetical protein [Bacteriovorax sp. BSW11_IV]|uniref:hypothetical protein n=1 Tax=Bacteriovorax sp. BSW11_IV TaxID=1353529 RepID=UPI0005516147|nr:hypothetical protein [Bacteriovorax sp. BSW11_IV]